MILLLREIKNLFKKISYSVNFSLTLNKRGQKSCGLVTLSDLTLTCRKEENQWERIHKKLKKRFTIRFMSCWKESISSLSCAMFCTLHKEMLMLVLLFCSFLFYFLYLGRYWRKELSFQLKSWGDNFFLFFYFLRKILYH